MTRRWPRIAAGTLCGLLASALFVVGESPAAGGWYLMLPPADPSPRDGRSTVPLREWASLESFDSATECETIRRAQIGGSERVVKSNREELPRLEKDPKLNDPRFLESMRGWFRSNEVLLERQRASLCIAGDDRRLAPLGPKGK